jgi:membrane protein
MARLRDLRPALRLLGPFRFGRNIWREVGEDNVFAMAAAVAYSWLFAVFPFLIFLLTLVAYVPLRFKMDAHDYLSSAVNRIMAPAAAETIMDNLDQVMHQPKGGLLSVGIALTLWAASGGVAMTMSALDAAFDAPKVRPFYKQRPIAILLTCVLTVMIIMVFVLLPVGTQVMRWLIKHGGLPWFFVWSVNFLRYGLALVLMFGVLATLYKFGTVVKQHFAFISPGAVFTVLVWFVLGQTFRFYVDHFTHYDKTYGAVGGVTIILLFFYLDALVLLIGAEINSEVDGALKTLAERQLAMESPEVPLLPAGETPGGAARG